MRQRVSPTSKGSHVKVGLCGTWSLQHEPSLPLCLSPSLSLPLSLPPSLSASASLSVFPSLTLSLSISFSLSPPSLSPSLSLYLFLSLSLPPPPPARLWPASPLPWCEFFMTPLPLVTMHYFCLVPRADFLSQMLSDLAAFHCRIMHSLQTELSLSRYWIHLLQKPFVAFLSE